VPPEEGPTGTTTVTWSTGDGSAGRVYVSVNGRPETLFAGDSSGSQDASWIAPGSTYEFRLYGEGEPRRLLAQVEVGQGVGRMNAVAFAAAHYAFLLLLAFASYLVGLGLTRGVEYNSLA